MIHKNKATTSKMANRIVKYNKRCDQSRGASRLISSVLKLSLLLFVLVNLAAAQHNDDKANDDDEIEVENGRFVEDLSLKRELLEQSTGPLVDVILDQNSTLCLVNSNEHQFVCMLSKMRNTTSKQLNMLFGLDCSSKYKRTENPTDQMSCSAKIEAFPHCYINMKFDRMVELPQLLLTVPSRYVEVCSKTTGHGKVLVDVEINDFGSKHSIAELFGKHDRGLIITRKFTLKNGTISTSSLGQSTRVGRILKDLAPDLIEFDGVVSDTSIASNEFELKTSQLKVNNSDFHGLEQSGFVLENVKSFELRNTKTGSQMSMDGGVELRWSACGEGPNVTRVVLENSISKEQQFPNQLIKVKKGQGCLENRTIELSLLKYDTKLSDKLRPFLTFAFNSNTMQARQMFSYENIDCCPLENRWFFAFLETLKNETINDRFSFSMACKDIQMRQASSIVGADAINAECSKPGKTRSFVIAIVFIAMAIILLVTTSCVFMFYVLPRSKGDTISLAPNAHLKHSMGGGGSGPSLSGGGGENSASTNKYPSIVEIKSTATASAAVSKQPPVTGSVRSALKSTGASSVASSGQHPSGQRTNSGSRRRGPTHHRHSRVAASKPIPSKPGKQVTSLASSNSRSLAGADKHSRSSASLTQKTANKK